MSKETFAIRVEQPIKLPTSDVLRRSIKGIKKKIRSEVDQTKRHQLKDIKRELQWLKNQL